MKSFVTIIEINVAAPTSTSNSLPEPAKQNSVSYNNNNTPSYRPKVSPGTILPATFNLSKFV